MVDLQEGWSKYKEAILFCDGPQVDLHSRGEFFVMTMEIQLYLCEFEITEKKCLVFWFLLLVNP